MILWPLTLCENRKTQPISVIRYIKYYAYFYHRKFIFTTIVITPPNYLFILNDPVDLNSQTEETVELKENP